LLLVTLRKPIKLVNSNEVHLALANHSEIDGLANINLELVTFLRNELNNDFINVIADVQEEKIVKKAYTNTDKFEAMMKNKPILRE